MVYNRTDRSISFNVFNKTYKSLLVAEYDNIQNGKNVTSGITSIENMIQDIRNTFNVNYEQLPLYKFDLYIDTLTDPTREEPIGNSLQFLHDNALYRIEQLNALIAEIKSGSKITKAYWNFYLQFLQFRYGVEYFKDSWFMVTDVYFSVNFLKMFREISGNIFGEENEKYWDVEPLRKSPYGSWSYFLMPERLNLLKSILEINSDKFDDYLLELKVFTEMVSMASDNDFHFVFIKR